MALLNRLFPTKKKTQKQGYVPFGRNDSISWKPFNFTKEQVRLLLFRECDARGRKLLFDSSAVQKTSLESPPTTKLKFGSKSRCDTLKKTEAYIEVTNGFGYQYLRPNADVTCMGEMIFGSVAMTFKGMTVKVHSMKSPERLMCTRVFHAPVISRNAKRKSDQSIESSGSSISSINDFVYGGNSNIESKLVCSGSSTGPLDVPHSEKSFKIPSSSIEGDSGYCGDASLHSMSSLSSGLWGPYPSGLDSLNSSRSTLSNNSGGSLASLQRRWMRNASTSLETESIHSSWGYESGQGSSGFGSDDGCQRSQRKTQLGLSFVINLPTEEEKDMEVFFFEHIAVIEHMMERLQCCIEKAYVKKDMFVHLMMDAFLDLQQWFSDLFTAPRILHPVWIGLASLSDMHRACSRFQFSLASSFLRDFCHLIAAIDTKATNFFISTLVTAVLTHHLGWVATVLPSKAPPNSVTKPPCTGQMLNDLAKSHPYNALWAQLGDLLGAAGHPVKVARTVVTANGKKSDLLTKLLNTLSYFIRCGGVERKVDSHFISESEVEVIDTVMESMSSMCLNTSTASTSTIVPGDEKVMSDSVVSDKTISLNFEELGNSTELEPIKSKEILKKSGFKRSSTFTNNMNCSMENKCSENVEFSKNNLYPNIANVQETFLNPEIISEKVSRLCRVPTNAVLYHMVGEENKLKSVENLLPKRVDCEKQFSSVDVLSKREKCVVLSDRSKENAPSFNSGIGEERMDKGKEDNVVFVLGENEELVDLKTQSGSIIPKSKSENVLFSDSEESPSIKKSNCYPSLEGLQFSGSESLSGKSSCYYSAKMVLDTSRKKLKSYELNPSPVTTAVSNTSFSNCEESALDSGIVLDESLKLGNKVSEIDLTKENLWEERTSASNNRVNVSSSVESNSKIRTSENVNNVCQRVVTARSSVIELEDECGVESEGVKGKNVKQVVRSQSLSFPISRNVMKRRSSTICRRHSENIHHNERYLRDYHSVRFNFERCDGVLNDYVDVIGVEKSPQNEQKSMKLNEARENFELLETLCDKCKQREHSASLNSVLRFESECNCIGRKYGSEKSDSLGAPDERREGNALFDQYGTSDDELLSSTEVLGRELAKKQPNMGLEEQSTLVELPLPRHIYSDIAHGSGIASSLLGGVSDHYMPDMVLHGCTQALPQWDTVLKRDLIISAHHSLLDQDVSEAVCIIGNVELWEVQLVSSHVSVIDKPGTFGIRVGMSQLVGNMLESLLHLWKLKTPPDLCLQHLESKLRELCLRSQVLAEFLLTTEFCDMATLTSSLGLEANDVPLLLAIASTHTPQVTAQYGLSFR